MNEWMKLLRARKWMKSNEPFLYAWHAYVGYELDLFDRFENGAMVEDVAARFDMDKLLLLRWAEVGVAIGHLKGHPDGKLTSDRTLTKYTSKRSPSSVGALLKEMMELHIPILLDYPHLLQKHPKTQYQDKDFAATVAETSTFIEKFAFPKLYKWMKKHRAKRLLDLGCGHAGYIARLSQKNKRFDLHGVEMNADVCNEAVSRLKRVNTKNTTIHQGDVRSWMWNGKPFDLVMMNNLLYYFSPEERASLFRKAYEMTNKKGTLVIISPLREPDHGHAFSTAFNSFMSAHDNLFTLPSKNEISQNAKENGFKLNKIKPVIKEGAWYFMAFKKK
ncbi:class I SAM-dependent methyltransferase [Pseudalkalibacillus sp. SCS-8]|uniref:class I SAM-dependent methyltransferase n=1 Tax=Pseudalkalibacillus nanhaiensis TaxID=3115291 RepID=UPI0032D9DAC7